jgi:hypothetical protein
MIFLLNIRGNKGLLKPRFSRRTFVNKVAINELENKYIMRLLLLILLMKFTLVNAQSDSVNNFIYVDDGYRVTSDYHYILLEDSIFQEKYNGYVSFTIEIDSLFEVVHWEVDVFRLFTDNKEDTVVDYFSLKNEKDIEVVQGLSHSWSRFIKSLIITPEKDEIIIHRAQVFIKVIAVPPNY